MPLSLRIAWRYSRSRGGFLSFVTAIAVAGLALGVAVLVVVLSVMNGFEQALRERVLGAVPHAVVLRSGGLENWRALAARAEEDPRVRAAAPRSSGAGLLAVDDRVAAVELEGVDPAAEPGVSIVPERMIAGRFDALEAGAWGVVLGSRLAARLDVSVGDAVTLVMPDPRVTLAGAFPRQKRLEIVGVFELRTMADDATVFVHLADAQRLLRIPGEAAGVRLRLVDLFEADAVLRDLLADDETGRLRGYDWRRTHGSLYESIGQVKRIMFVLLSLLIAVAAFNVVAMLTMVVRNRRGDVAILRTMGMLPGALVRIFFSQGAYIAAVGIGTGLLGGVLLTFVLPAAVGLLSELLGRDLLGEYFVREMPVAVRASDLVLVAAVAVVLAGLTIGWPARRALAVAPAEELRHE